MTSPEGASAIISFPTRAPDLREVVSLQEFRAAMREGAVGLGNRAAKEHAGKIEAVDSACHDCFNQIDSVIGGETGLGDLFAHVFTHFTKAVLRFEKSKKVKVYVDWPVLTDEINEVVTVFAKTGIKLNPGLLANIMLYHGADRWRDFFTSELFTDWLDGANADIASIARDNKLCLEHFADAKKAYDEIMRQTSAGAQYEWCKNSPGAVKHACLASPATVQKSLADAGHTFKQIEAGTAHGWLQENLGLVRKVLLGSPHEYTTILTRARLLHMEMMAHPDFDWLHDSPSLLVEGCINKPEAIKDHCRACEPIFDRAMTPDPELEWIQSSPAEVKKVVMEKGEGAIRYLRTCGTQHAKILANPDYSWTGDTHVLKSFILANPKTAYKRLDDIKKAADDKLADPRFAWAKNMPGSVAAAILTHGKNFEDFIDGVADTLEEIQKGISASPTLRKWQSECKTLLSQIKLLLLRGRTVSMKTLQASRRKFIAIRKDPDFSWILSRKNILTKIVLEDADGAEDRLRTIKSIFDRVMYDPRFVAMREKPGTLMQIVATHLEQTEAYLLSERPQEQSTQEDASTYICRPAVVSRARTRINVPQRTPSVRQVLEEVCGRPARTADETAREKEDAHFRDTVRTYGERGLPEELREEIVLDAGVVNPFFATAIIRGELPLSGISAFTATPKMWNANLSPCRSK